MIMIHFHVPSMRWQIRIHCNNKIFISGPILQSLVM